jgi:hypothetical protein
VVRRKVAEDFSPAEISGLALWLDASDSSTLFQNSDGTVPATASSDPVGAWLDKSGNARHATQSVSGSRPTISAMGSRRALRLGASGAVSRLSLGNLSAAFPAAGNVFVAFQPNSDSQYTLYSTRNNDDTYANTSTSLWGTWVNTRTSVTSSRPSSGAHVANLYGTSGSFSVIEDGALIHSSSALAWEPGNDHNIGSRPASAAGQTPLDGWIGEVIAYNRALTTAERQRLERYLAAKWGITLAPQVSNADAQDWINRVYANGGTVSSSTASAVNTLCDSLDAASLRHRFYRLNLFCGTGLNACLVPLYRGPSLSGTQYGNTTDTNVGPFVTGDYAETGASSGLVGNGTNKYLNTGLNGSELAAGNRHAASYDIVSATTDYSPSVVSGSGLATQHGIGPWVSASTVAYRTHNTVGGNASTTKTTGMWLGSDTSSTASVIYKNGTSVASTSGQAAGGSGNTAYYILGNPAGEWSEARLGGYSIGLSMTASQAAAYYTAMQAFQTALTRNV